MSTPAIRMQALGLLLRDCQPEWAIRTSKACSTCAEVKPLADFPPNSRTRDGRQARCRSCIRSRARG